MTADAEIKYYQASSDEIDSHSVTSGHRSRMSRMALIAIGGSCLVLVLMAAFVSTGHVATPTYLVGLSPSLRSSSGAVKPSIINNIVLPGSSPFQRIALSAIEANNLRNQGRDVSMRATQVAQGELKGELVNADAKTKATVKKMEKAVVSKVESMPGIIEPLGLFDPLGISSEVPEGRLLFFREVEIKHGRVAMLASLGLLVGEQFHPMFGGNVDVPSYVAFQQTPLQTFWPAVVVAIAIPEVFCGLYEVKPEEVGASAYVSSKFEEDVTVQTLFLTNRQWTMKAGHKSGDWGFDPLGLKPSDPNELREMQNKELNTGRLAMIAAAGMIAKELVTGQKLI